MTSPGTTTPPARRRALRLAVPTLAVALAVGALAACTSSSTTATAGSPAGTAVTPPGSATTVATAPTSSSSSGSIPPGSSAPYGGAPAWPAAKTTLSIDVDGTTRTATLVVPKDLTKPAPLVFAFHGHGGSGDNFDRKLDVEGLWPEAIVVYPDGLVGHKGKTDPEGVKPGWQTVVGGEGDRDLHFYDALFAKVTGGLPVDRDRIYLMGHSNGSQFASLLLNQRGAAIAATANMSSQAGELIATDPVRSMFMSMGEKDPIVPIEGQKKSIPLAEQHLGVDPAKATTNGLLRSEPGRGNLELEVYDYPDGHEVPDAVPALVVAFFQRHTLSGG